MENGDKDKNAAKEWSDLLGDERISLIDFDRLREWLAQAGSQLDELARCRAELELLRQDMVGRISGMVKAIAIADRKSERLESALVYLESLSNLAAADLLVQHRRVAACFRDAFPMSHSSAAPAVGATCRAQDSSVLK